MKWLDFFIASLNMFYFQKQIVANVHIEVHRSNSLLLFVLLCVFLCSWSKTAKILQHGLLFLLSIHAQSNSGLGDKSWLKIHLLVYVKNTELFEYEVKSFPDWYLKTFTIYVDSRKQGWKIFLSNTLLMKHWIVKSIFDREHVVRERY